MIFAFFLSSILWAQEFAKTKMTLGPVHMSVEVADTEGLREKGLMGRNSLKDTEGMIFIFDHPQPLNFWMKNTLIPLSIGYFDEHGELFQVLDMEPASPMDMNPKTYNSTRPAKFALEEPQGWFKRKKIFPGKQSRLGLPDRNLP
jgi:uncharacterized membrane protein (UPF0127 family)